MNHAKCYKKGYPRPRFVRESFISLNGEWDFAFDDDNVGERERYFLSPAFGKKITVPFAYQTAASGIGDESRHDYLWYAKKFDYTLPKGKRLLVHFDGADYKTKVWLNGNMLGTHTGGYARFTFDLTDYLIDDENVLVVKCEDSYSLLTPRGKQRYVEKNVSCFYTDTSGIWKTVWLEEVSDCYLESVLTSCEYKNRTAVFEYKIANHSKGVRFCVEASYMGNVVAYEEHEAVADYGVVRIDLTLKNQILCLKPWSLGRTQQIFDLRYFLKKDGKVIDEVGSYTGLVNYRTKGNTVQVNYLPNYYFRMVLDQGYFPDSGMTPKTDDELLNDVLLMKEMGFNGVRKHQKIEDERFYYFCDMVGLFCWLEMPAMYDFTPESVSAFTAEWTEVLRQHKGYLSIMAYVPVNESWGVLQTAENEQMQQFTAGLYGLTKAIDNTRLVISNDGWEHTVSDIATVHNYTQVGKELTMAYGDMETFMKDDFTGDLHTRTAYADGWEYGGQPVIVSEYAGIAFRKDEGQGWGYGTSVADGDAFVQRLKELTQAIVDLKGCQGYCITQLTDVMQEMNGLLTETREPKVALERIKEINSLTPVK